MSLPNPNPALDPNAPYFQDNSFVRGDHMRNNNALIWGNFDWLDWAVKSEKVLLENSDRLGLADSADSFNLKGVTYQNFLAGIQEYLTPFFNSVAFLRQFALINWFRIPFSFSVSTLNCIAYGDGTFVALYTGGAARSIDGGYSWTNFSISTIFLWTGVAFGNSVFVGVSSTGGSQRVVRSTNNGATFSFPASQPETNNWQDVAFGNGVFVAVANSGTNRVMRSTNDGVTWSVVPVELSAWKAIAFGINTFIAVANSGPGVRVMRSVDNGASFNIVAVSTNAWQDVAYGNGVFVVVANTGTNRIMRSINGGATWIEITGLPAGLLLTTVTFVNGLFIAFEPNSILYSGDNGQTWIQTTNKTGFVDFFGSVAGDGVVMAVGGSSILNTPAARSLKLPPSPAFPGNDFGVGNFGEFNFGE